MVVAATLMFVMIQGVIKPRVARMAWRCVAKQLVFFTRWYNEIVYAHHWPTSFRSHQLLGKTIGDCNWNSGQRWAVEVFVSVLNRQRMRKTVAVVIQFRFRAANRTWRRSHPGPLPLPSFQMTATHLIYLIQVKSARMNWFA
jgi:hypothetical protein